MIGEKIKLIAKPTPPNICLFVCAVLKNDMTILMQQPYYIIEDGVGNRYVIYARNDKDFCRKIEKKCQEK